MPRRWVLPRFRSDSSTVPVGSGVIQSIHAAFWGPQQRFHLTSRVIHHPGLETPLRVPNARITGRRWPFTGRTGYPFQHLQPVNKGRGSRFTGGSQSGHRSGIATSEPVESANDLGNSEMWFFGSVYSNLHSMGRSRSTTGEERRLAWEM